MPEKLEQPSLGSLPDQPSQTAGEAALEAANKMLRPGGQRIEALGSDALQRWMHEGGIEERDSNYWRAR